MGIVAVKGADAAGRDEADAIVESQPASVETPHLIRVNQVTQSVGFTMGSMGDLMFSGMDDDVVERAPPNRGSTTAFRNSSGQVPKAFSHNLSSLPSKVFSTAQAGAWRIPNELLVASFRSLQERHWSDSLHTSPQRFTSRLPRPWQSQHPFLLWFHDESMENAFASYFYHPMRNAAIYYSFFISLVVLAATFAFWQGGTLPTFLVIRSICIMVLLLALAGCIILKIFQPPLVEALASFDALPKRVVAPHQQHRAPVARSTPSLENGGDDKCFEALRNSVTNALLHEGCATAILIADLVLATSYLLGKGDCSYVPEARRNIDCVTSIFVEGCFAYVMMVHTFFTPIRFPRLISWTLPLSTLYFVAPLFDGTLAIRNREPLVTLHITSGAALVIGIVSVWLKERKSRLEFQYYLERHLKSEELIALRQQRERMVSAELPLAAVRAGVMDAAGVGSSWLIGNRAVVCAVCLDGFASWSFKRGAVDTMELLQRTVAVFDGVRDTHGTNTTSVDKCVPLTKYHALGDHYIVNSEDDLQGPSCHRHPAKRAEVVLEVLRFAIGCAVFGSDMIHQSESNETWFNFNPSLTPREALESYRGRKGKGATSHMGCSPPSSSHSGALRIRIAIAEGRASGFVVKRSKSLCIVGPAVSDALAMLRLPMASLLQQPHDREIGLSVFGSLFDVKKAPRRTGQGATAQRSGSNVAMIHIGPSVDDNRRSTSSSQEIDPFQASLLRYIGANDLPLVLRSPEGMHYTSLVVGGQEFVERISTFNDVDKDSSFLLEDNVMWLLIGNSDCEQQQSPTAGGGHGADDGTFRNNTATTPSSRSVDAFVTDVPSPIDDVPVVAVVAAQDTSRRIFEETIRLESHCLRLFSTFAFTPTEDLFHATSKSNDGVDMIWGAVSTLIALVPQLVFGLVFEPPIANGGHQTPLSATWAVVGIVSSMLVAVAWYGWPAFFGNCSWRVVTTPDGNAVNLFPRRVITVILSLFSIVCYCCCVFSATTGTPVNNTHILWGYTVLNASLLCPNWGRVQLLCLQDFFFFFALLLRVGVNRQIYNEIWVVDVYVIFSMWVSCVFSRVLMDHSRREAFITSLHMSRLTEEVEADQKLLEDALRIMTPEGVAAALIEKSRMHRKEALQKKKLGQRTNGAMLMICYLRTLRSTAISTTTQDVPFIVLELSPPAKSILTTLRTLFECLDEATALWLSKHEAYGALDVLKCSGDVVMIAAPPPPKGDPHSFSCDEPRAAALLYCAWRASERLRTEAGCLMTGGNKDTCSSFRMVVDCGPVMGGIMGSIGPTFEYYGGPVSVALRLARDLEWGSTVASQRVLAYGELGGFSINCPMTTTALSGVTKLVVGFI